MSGTLIIRDDVTWMPRGWIFDGVLRRVADELAIEDAPLATMLSEARTSMRAYGDLRPLDPGRFGALLRAAVDAYDRAVERGPYAFHDPTAYAEFMFLFSTFKALLRTAPRAGRQERAGEIVTGPTGVWAAPGWVVDLVLEHLAAAVRMADERLSDMLIAGRTLDGSGRCDLRPLQAERFHSLLPPTEWMYIRYGDGQGRDTYAPTFFATLAPYILAFAAQLGIGTASKGVGSKQLRPR